MESVWSVSKLSTESVSSRRELVANCVHTADADATKQFRRPTTRRNSTVSSRRRRQCVLGLRVLILDRKAGTRYLPRRDGRPS